jgi:hypothetical protein
MCTRKKSRPTAEEQKYNAEESESNAGETTSVSTGHENDDDDPNDLLNLETLRLSFLDVGPSIQNLDFCEKITEVFLNHN